MKKFAILALAVLTALSLLAGCSGNNKKEGVYKIGIVQFVDDASLNQIRVNVENRLDELSKALGVKFEYTSYNGQADASTLNQIAATLISRKVDLIIPIATPAAQIMLSATEGKNIPIVFSAVSDPVGAGLVESLTSPGGIATGTSDALDTDAVINLMLAVNPEIKSVGLLYSKSENASEKPIARAKEILAKKGISVVEKTGTRTDEIVSAADALVAAKVDAVFTPTDNTVMTAELAIYEKFANAAIPHYCGADSFALNGAFCGYGVNYAALGVVTADIAADILTGKTTAADCAVRLVDGGIATVNTETLAKIGLDEAKVTAAISPLCSAVIKTVTKEAFD